MPKSITPVKIVTEDEPEEAERIDVFSIDGEMYSMPAEIDGHFALEVLEQIRTSGVESVVAWMVEEAVGSKGYRALRNCQTLKTSDLKAVINIVQDHVLGAVEDIAGK